MACSSCTCEVLNAYVLLDRSGSMSTRWNEALGSVNAYVEGLAKVPAKVTLATFDDVAGIQFDVIRDAVPVAEWKNVTDEDASPRGGTPLLDAIGRVVALAEKAADEKTVIIVMTDGQENQSREVTKHAAKAALNRCAAKKWEVVFLGADFNAFGEAANVGVVADKVMNLTAGNYAVAMRGFASKSADYAMSGAAVNFTEEDRRVAAGEPPIVT